MDLLRVLGLCVPLRTPTQNKLTAVRSVLSSQGLLSNGCFTFLASVQCPRDQMTFSSPFCPYSPEPPLAAQLAAELAAQLSHQVPPFFSTPQSKMSERAKGAA